MTPERWAEVKRVFDDVIDLPPAQQATQVHGCCGADVELEREVLRLVGAHRESEDLLEVPLADLHSFLAAPIAEEALLRVGATVTGRFEVLRFLSRGGMGEVYEAWDAELQTAVALKTIRPRMASDAVAIERFKKEVKHAREISHPNICRVHELFSQEVSHTGNQKVPGGGLLSGRSGGSSRVWFLSMELLAGPTLLERLRDAGPLTPAAALHIARQLVSGLAAAHALGLVHRDFKSSNIMLVPDNDGRERAVITDFGLTSKMLSPGADHDDGERMGTPGYMAPEQESGGEVGPLADQFALGAVLCEMLTGSLPRWSAAQAGDRNPVLELPDGKLPGKWKTAICRCLEWEPQHRFAHVEEVLRYLEGRSVLRRPASIAAAAVLLLAGLICAEVFWLHREKGCEICDLVQLTPETDESESPAISRDSHTVAYSSDRADNGNLDIFLQRLPDGRPVRVTRDPARDGDPSLSPDGAVVAFRSERKGGGIYIAGAKEGDERLLVQRGRNPQISPDGRSLLYWTGDMDSGVASGRIYVQPVDGGAPRQLGADFEDARFPVWSPDGRALIFSGCRSDALGMTAKGDSDVKGSGQRTLSGCTDWWAMSLDGSRVVNTHVLERLRARAIVLARPNVGVWYADGLLFGGGLKGVRLNLWTIPLDRENWEATGDPRQLLDEPARDLSPSLSTGRTLAYTRISGALHVWQMEKAFTAKNARLSKVTDDADIDGFPFVAEGGRSLVFARGRGSERSVWIRDAATSGESLLLRSGMPIQSPILDAAGDLLVYEQMESHGTSIYARSGTGVPRRICHGCSLPSGWFNNAQAFFYRDGLPASIKMADPRTGAMRVVLGESRGSLGDATWSPANEHLLFTETEGGLKRMFAVRMPRLTGEVTGRWIPIPDGGVTPEHPRWSGDGRTVVYISNSDGFTCIYGWTFSPEKEAMVGRPFSIAHFHNQRASIDNVLPSAFNLSVDGDSVFFNLGEQSSTVWTGIFKK